MEMDPGDPINLNGNWPSSDSALFPGWIPIYAYDARRLLGRFSRTRSPRFHGRIDGASDDFAATHGGSRPGVDRVLDR